MVDLKSELEIEVLSAADAARRRHWSDEDKLRMVEESFIGHRQVSATARRHGVSRSLLTVWRRQYRNGEFGGGPSPAFIPVALSARPAASVSTAQAPSNAEAKAEIALRNGRRLVVPVTVAPEVLARLLQVVDPL